MNESQDEGLEVNLLSNGNSFVSPRPLDINGFQKWMKSIEQDMPQLLEEQRAAQHMGDIQDAFIERYLTGKEESIMIGYRLVLASTLTKLSRGGLKFDNKVEVTYRVDHMLDILGYCPVLQLYHIDDYRLHIKNNGENSEKPYLGRIKIVTLDEIFY